MTPDRSATAAVVTVSDGVTQGSRLDESGDLAASILRDAGFSVGAREVVPDERDIITDTLRRLAAAHDLVVTTGGTGFGPRDVTPEATRAILEREAPGLGELMRAVGLTKTPMAALSRATAGTVGSAVVLNLPGSPTGVRESLEAVMGVLPHAVELVSGTTGPHPTGHPSPGVPPSSSDDHVIRHPWVDVKAVKIVEGNPPCRVGSSMHIVPGGRVHGTLGCAEFDDAAVTAAAEALETGEPTTRVFHHDLGAIEVFLEPHAPPSHAIVVSATDVARGLRSHLRRLGYQTVLVESRGGRATDADAPSVTSIGELDLDAFAAAVLTDHDAPEVTETLASLLRSPVPFIGVMGSRRHVGHYVETLRGQGFTDEELARIRSPLGLDLGGRSPEEIALSIVAGIVADRYGRDGGWLDR